MKLFKPLEDLLSGVKILAMSWTATSFGIADADSIMQTVSERFDLFINEYLRVNADACGQ